jgi:hypothetical protein
MATFPHMVVTVIGPPASGVSSLVNALARELEQFQTFAARRSRDWHEIICATVRQTFSAFKSVAGGCGAILDGSLSYELALICVDLRNGRLSQAEAEVLIAFGEELERHLPAPHLLLHLDASPSACLGRADETDGPSLEDIKAVDEAVQEIVASFRTRGTQIFRRKWDAFGKTSAMRDTILCADRPSRSAIDLAPPSEAAVERILADAWAAAQPNRRRLSERDSSSSNRDSSGDHSADVSLSHESTSPSMKKATADAEASAPTPTDSEARRPVAAVTSTPTRPTAGRALPLSPLSPAEENSPASVLTREENMPTSARTMRPQPRPPPYPGRPTRPHMSGYTHRMTMPVRGVPSPRSEASACWLWPKWRPLGQPVGLGKD